MHQLGRTGGVAIALLLIVAIPGCASANDLPNAAQTTPSDPIATLSSGDEAVRMVIDCLEARGWVVSANSSGGISAEFANEQLDQFEADHDACHEGYTFREWTDSDYVAAYEAALAVQRCLEDHDYDVLAEIPSQPVFTQQYKEGVNVWDPYGALSETEFPGVFADCPQPDPIF